MREAVSGKQGQQNRMERPDDPLVQRPSLLTATEAGAPPYAGLPPRPVRHLKPGAGGSSSAAPASSEAAMERIMDESLAPLRDSMQKLQDSMAALTSKVEAALTHEANLPANLDVNLSPSSVPMLAAKLADNLDALFSEAAQPEVEVRDRGSGPSPQQSPQMAETTPGKQGGALSVVPKESKENRKSKEDHIKLMHTYNADRTKETGCAAAIERGVHWFEALEEPERTGALHSVVKSNNFEKLAAAAIILNTMFVAVTSNWEMENLGARQPRELFYIECAFVLWYSFEIGLRLINHGGWFFVNSDMRWNIADFGLVGMSWYDMYMVVVVLPGSSSRNVATMRMIRLLKLAKIGRTLRVMRVFKDLALIFGSFMQSIVPLFWCFVMLTMVIYVFALVFVQGLSGYLANELTEMNSAETGQMPENMEEIKECFGSVQQAMLTLYMAVTGGDDWSNYYNILIHAGLPYGIAFIFFTFFFIFSLFNILTSVFVEKVVIAGEPDRQAIILEQRRKRMKEAEEMKNLCYMMDADGTGTITKKEFMNNMKNELMVNWMSANGLEVHDVTLFFDIVSASSGQDEVPIGKFADGCLSMKGQASSVDMQKAIFLQQANEDKLRMIDKDMKERMRHLAHMVARLGQSMSADKIAEGSMSLRASLSGAPSITSSNPCSPLSAADPISPAATQAAANVPTLVKIAAAANAGPRNAGLNAEETSAQSDVREAARARTGGEARGHAEAGQMSERPRPEMFLAKE